jgi:hypothetical protein
LISTIGMQLPIRVAINQILASLLDAEFLSFGELCFLGER